MNKPLHKVPPSYQGYTRADFSLNPQQWAYVLHRITQAPGVTNAKCAQAAGYQCKPNSEPQVATHPDVNRAITTLDNQAVQEVEERHIAQVITREQGLQVLSDIAQGEEERAMDRIKAVEVLARMQRWGETTAKPVTINIDTQSALEGIQEAERERQEREARADSLEPGQTALVDIGPQGPEPIPTETDQKPQQHKATNTDIKREPVDSKPTETDESLSREGYQVNGVPGATAAKAVDAVRRSR